ncbi:hypothetical protein ENBRE01_3286 [Enteropsectra breve]|nr:hypothetical protein ENBRE01_3286 [Enteropsectra breve]
MDENLDVPKSYRELKIFIEKNKATLFTDKILSAKVFKVLNELLESTNAMSDLYQDVVILNETVKLLESAFLREYENRMSIERILELADAGDLDRYFLEYKRSSYSAVFMDRLNLDFAERAAHPQRERKSYKMNDGPVAVPDLLNEADEKKQGKYIEGIKRAVENKGRIEYFTLILNPKSFSKSVFNAFNLALSLRNKAVSLEEKDSIIYVVPYREPEEKETPSHGVLSLTPARHKELVKALNIQEAVL